MSLPSFSVRNSVLVNMLMLVLLASGFIFAFTLRREMFPESRPDKLLISAIYPGVQPEDDTDTFNGATWKLARDIFLPLGAGEDHPLFAKALEYYEGRAYPPGLLWDWTGKEERLKEYRDLIKRSDEALRTASVVLGAVVANHLLSAVDAFVSSHLPVEGSVSASAGLRGRVQGPVLEWMVEVRP